MVAEPLDFDPSTIDLVSPELYERNGYPHDEWTWLRPGALGTVTVIDDLGTVHVRWDDGGTLGLVPDEDEWVVLDG